MDARVELGESGVTERSSVCWTLFHLSVINLNFAVLLADMILLKTASVFLPSVISV